MLVYKVSAKGPSKKLVLIEVLSLVFGPSQPS
jgi:hypothetical protein